MIITIINIYGCARLSQGRTEGARCTRNAADDAMHYHIRYAMYRTFALKDVAYAAGIIYMVYGGHIPRTRAPRAHTAFVMHGILMQVPSCMCTAHA